MLPFLKKSQLLPQNQIKTMETKDIKLTTLGLAVRAGKAVWGTQPVCDALREKHVYVVIEAQGNSDNTAKRLSDRCAFYKVPLILCSADAETLGRAIGKGPVSSVAITDASLALAVTGTSNQGKA